MALPRCLGQRLLPSLPSALTNWRTRGTWGGRGATSCLHSRSDSNVFGHQPAICVGLLGPQHLDSGFGTSKRAAKGLFEKAFSFLGPFRKSRQARHLFDKKKSFSCLLFWKKIPNYYQLSIGLMLTTFHPQTSQLSS